MSREREELRLTFDEVAELYDVARPDYPSALVDDLVALTGVDAGSRVLEIGCGTGQLSVALAKRQLALFGVELGPELAAVARRNLAPFPRTEVVVAAFEDWPLPVEPFDLVVAATSFHWIDPSVRVVKAARALGHGGWLAVVGTEHVAGDDRFFIDVQDCYVQWHPDVDEAEELVSPDGVPTAFPELDESPLFGPVALRRYVWDQTYTTAQYLDVLSTYSGHIAMPDSSRRGPARVHQRADRHAVRRSGHQDLPHRAARDPQGVIRPQRRHGAPPSTDVRAVRPRAVESGTVVLPGGDRHPARTREDRNERDDGDGDRSRGHRPDAAGDVGRGQGRKLPAGLDRTPLRPRRRWLARRQHDVLHGHGVAQHGRERLRLGREGSARRGARPAARQQL